MSKITPKVTAERDEQLPDQLVIEPELRTGIPATMAESAQLL